MTSAIILRRYQSSSIISLSRAKNNDTSYVLIYSPLYMKQKGILYYLTETKTKAKSQIFSYTPSYKGLSLYVHSSYCSTVLLLWHNVFRNSHFSNWHRIKKGCSLLLFNYSALRNAADVNKRHQNRHLHEESLISKGAKNLYFRALIFRCALRAFMEENGKSESFAFSWDLKHMLICSAFFPAHGNISGTLYLACQKEKIAHVKTYRI